MTAQEYARGQEPDVEVQLDDGIWVQGEATMREQREDGWWYRCRWRCGPATGTHTDWFGPGRVREDTVDRSYGRKS